MRIFGFTGKKKEKKGSKHPQAAGAGSSLHFDDRLSSGDESSRGSDMDEEAYTHRRHGAEDKYDYVDYDEDDDDPEDFRSRADYADEPPHDNAASGKENNKEEDEEENEEREEIASKAYTDVHNENNYCSYAFGVGTGKDGVDEEQKDEGMHAAMDLRAIEQDKIIARNQKLIKFLSKDERVRAKQVFRLLDVHNDGKIDDEGFTAALALLGMKISEKECSELFLSRKIDLVDEVTFLSMVGEYRANAADEEQIAQIEGAFEDLYRGILAEREGQFAEQRDGIGRPYILAADLRNLLVTTGESMTDEEADQLIADCKPIYKVQADGTVTGKIFFEQYRSMLLPGPN